MEWSWNAWGVSVAAVVASGAIAWIEGNWTRRAGLGMGFANHGGMWGDLVLLPMANAAIVPHVAIGWWLAAALACSAIASFWVHRHWYAHGDARSFDFDATQSGETDDDRAGDHMWPSRTRGTWSRDLSWSGWAHVVYVTGELTLLAGCALHRLPAETIIFVAAIFTVHVPIGLLQPRWFLTGHIATAAEQPLLLPALAAVWIVTALKL